MNNNNSSPFLSPLFFFGAEKSTNWLWYIKNINFLLFICIAIVRRQRVVVINIKSNIYTYDCLSINSERFRVTPRALLYEQEGESTVQKIRRVGKEMEIRQKKKRRRKRKRGWRCALCVHDRRYMWCVKRCKSFVTRNCYLYWFNRFRERIYEYSSFAMLYTREVPTYLINVPFPISSPALCYSSRSAHYIIVQARTIYRYVLGRRASSARRKRFSAINFHGPECVMAAAVYRNSRTRGRK